MSNPLSMFHEKQAEGAPWSMTRTVAFLFAITYCTALIIYATHAFAINWPFAILGCITLGAVPLQGMLTYLQHWIATGPGRALLGKLVEHYAPSVVGTVASTVSTSTVTTTPASQGEQ